MDRSEEKLAALQNFWDLYRSIFAQEGLDIAAECGKWAKLKRRKLETYDGDFFDALCKAGCKELPLAILMAIIQPLRSLETKWTKIAGTPRQREQKIRTLEKAAVVLEDLLGSLADTDGRKERLLELSRPSNNALISAMETQVPHPAITIHALRTYSSILYVFADAQKDTTVASSDMLAKYLFSAYVYRATRRFHDSEVSALIGTALGITYDETAHRMWRKRNYKRIDKRLSGIANLLTDLGEVSAT